MSKLERIAIYGKGGIGKSMVATSLSATFAKDGRRVLHVGCDPKHDSAVRLMDGGVQIPTVLEVIGDDPSAVSTEAILHEGRMGIVCAEAGGPRPGVGCGGRGVARTLEFLDDMEVIDSGNFDVVVFDVLGDVVCGGFAAPLRQRFAEKIVIVMSEEPMAMYAANNIARAVEIYHENGVQLAGLVANVKQVDDKDLEMLHRFAERLSTRILAVIRRDPLVITAERKRQTVVEYAPEAETSQTFVQLAAAITELDTKALSLPTPMEDPEFYAFLEQW